MSLLWFLRADGGKEDQDWNVERRDGCRKNEMGRGWCPDGDGMWTEWLCSAGRQREIERRLWTENDYGQRTRDDHHRELGAVDLCDKKRRQKKIREPGTHARKSG